MAIGGKLFKSAIRPAKSIISIKLKLANLSWGIYYQTMIKLYLLISVVALFTSGCAVKPSYSSTAMNVTKEMDIREAKAVLSEKLNMVFTCGIGGKPMTARKIEYKPAGVWVFFEWEEERDLKKAVYKYNLKPEVEVQAGGAMGYYMAVTVLGKKNASEGMCFYWPKESDSIVAAQALHAVQKYLLLHSQPNLKGEFEQFQQQARKFRKQAKNPLPEEARKFKVQGDAAFKEKNFDSALELYGKALEVAPWWSTGYYNRALLLGDDGSFGEAILEMKKYLELQPPEDDARKAQDRIYVWESKINNG